MPEILPHPAACDQALPSPRSLTAARNQAESPNSPMSRRTPPVKMRMPRPARVKLRFRVMARWHPMVKRSKDTLKSKTPSLALAKSSVQYAKDTDSESEPGEKIQSVQQKWHQPSPKEGTPPKDSSGSSSEEEQPTDKALHDKTWQRAWQLDTNFNAWWCKKIAKGITGWATRDTMICDLPKHGKA